MIINKQMPHKIKSEKMTDETETLYLDQEKFDQSEVLINSKFFLSSYGYQLSVHLPKLEFWVIHWPKRENKISKVKDELGDNMWHFGHNNHVVI